MTTTTFVMRQNVLKRYQNRGKTPIVCSCGRCDTEIHIGDPVVTVRHNTRSGNTSTVFHWGHYTDAFGAPLIEEPSA